MNSCAKFHTLEVDDQGEDEVWEAEKHGQAERQRPPRPPREGGHRPHLDQPGQGAEAAGKDIGVHVRTPSRERQCRVGGEQRRSQCRRQKAERPAARGRHPRGLAPVT